MTIQQILIKYWGYSTFRPLQEDIINSVLAGKDTLALMPTGGGKSICFQVPGLAIDGICIVISPLIALMKDQVDNLRLKKINAVAVYSGMHKSEIDIALDNCIYGDVKFLYVSPERLESEVFKQRLAKMKVNLIAVDEAHCISHWGYDFRPPYLKIAEIRKIIPNTPILALTATATPDVVNDIQQKLEFAEENVFIKSFERSNLSYVVIKEENKLGKLLEIANKVSGTGIVYVRSRRKTKEISDFLNKNGIKSSFYHAGLSPNDRNDHQKLWMSNNIRVIVATNAFGMGIDKPNVRFVIHMDLPDNLESYFQEAGRAGRDEHKSFAVLLFDEQDITHVERILEINFPEIKFIKAVYDSLGSYFQLPVGSGKDESFVFDIHKYSEKIGQNSAKVFNALRLLEKEGYLLLSDSISLSSKILINVDKEELYRFQVKYSKFDSFIKVLLRSYTGVFNDFVKINESEIAQRNGTSLETVSGILKQLDNLNIITYIPKEDMPQIVYCTERIDSGSLAISVKEYNHRKGVAADRLSGVLEYISTTTRCRSQILLEYFGEKNSRRCGKCDVCLKRNIIELSQLEFDSVLEQIKPLMKDHPCTIEELVKKIKNMNEDKVIKVIQWLLDNDKVKYENNMVSWK